jgi:hypothetical protein
MYKINLHEGTLKKAAIFVLNFDTCSMQSLVKQFQICQYCSRIVAETSQSHMLHAV